MLKIGDDTYLFGKDGKLKKNVFHVADENKYYFDSEGKMTSSTWITIDDNKYYLKADGRIAKSETIIIVRNTEPCTPNSNDSSKKPHYILHKI